VRPEVEPRPTSPATSAASLRCRRSTSSDRSGSLTVWSSMRPSIEATCTRPRPAVVPPWPPARRRRPARVRG
jgi:hypothetical protein